MSDTRTPANAGQAFYEAACRAMNIRADFADWRALGQHERDNFHREAKLLQEDAASAVMAGQEPVAEWWHAECVDPDRSGFYRTKAEALTQVSEHGGTVTALYAAPPSTAALVEALNGLLDASPRQNDLHPEMSVHAQRDFDAALARARSVLAAHQENPNG